jgi:hypothetical protein
VSLLIISLFLSSGFFIQPTDVYPNCMKHFFYTKFPNEFAYFFITQILPFNGEHNRAIFVHSFFFIYVTRALIQLAQKNHPIKSLLGIWHILFHKVAIYTIYLFNLSFIDCMDICRPRLSTTLHMNNMDSLIFIR